MENYAFMDGLRWFRFSYRILNLFIATIFNSQRVTYSNIALNIFFRWVTQLSPLFSDVSCLIFWPPPDLPDLMCPVPFQLDWCPWHPFFGRTYRTSNSDEIRFWLVKFIQIHKIQCSLFSSLYHEIPIHCRSRRAVTFQLNGLCHHHHHPSLATDPNSEFVGEICMMEKQSYTKTWCIHVYPVVN